LDIATTNVDPTDNTGLVDTASPELGAEGGQPAFAKAMASGSSFSQSTSDSLQSTATINSSSPKELNKQKIGRPAERGNRPAKLGRNDPCPCGSGKKYKKCHYPQYG
jgi:uncharacterized protein YecA (UPF0149 family)